MKTTPKIEINEANRLYIIPSGKGFSCLGFDVLERRTVALMRELAARGHTVPAPARVGTLERYEQYVSACEVAQADCTATGWRSKSELTPQLIGLEGKRVEVIDSYGETRRFLVGRSTGHIPCHLEITRRNSSGGGAVSGAPFASVRIVA